MRVCPGEILGSSGIPNTPPTSGIPSTVAALYISTVTALHSPCGTYITYIYTSTFCTVQNKHTLPIYFVLYNTTSLSIKTLILHCSALFWIVKQCPASQRCCVCFSSSFWLHLGSWNESKAICWSNSSNIKESILCDDRHLRKTTLLTTLNISPILTPSKGWIFF